MCFVSLFFCIDNHNGLPDVYCFLFWLSCKTKGRTYNILVFAACSFKKRNKKIRPRYVEKEGKSYGKENQERNSEGWRMDR